VRLTPRGEMLRDRAIMLSCCAAIAAVLLLALTGGF
jgi:hypothetical protein